MVGNRVLLLQGADRNEEVGSEEVGKALVEMAYLWVRHYCSRVRASQDMVVGHSFAESPSVEGGCPCS